MNPQIRRLWLIVIGLFLILALFTSYIQVICSSNILGSSFNLNADPRNTRSAQRAKYIQRGPILAGNTTLVNSIAAPNNPSFRKQYQRNYLVNGKDLTEPYAHLLGYVTNSNLTGIERLENSILMGENASNSIARWSDLITGTPPTGSGIKLTIDPAMQEAAYNAIGSRRGAAVAINYKTGAILAAVSRPSYSLAQFSKLDPDTQTQFITKADHDPNHPLLNRAFNGAYAPGSSFKLITVAAAMENLKVEPDTNVPAPVFLPYPTNPRNGIHNIDDHPCGNGNPTLTEAFARSCNTPFASFAEKMGHQVLQKKAEDFGFNTKSPWEVPIKINRSWFPIQATPENISEKKNETNQSKPTIWEQHTYPAKNIGDFVLQEGIGQWKIETNPMEMASVAGTIANQGTQIKPYLIKAYTDLNGKEKTSFNGGKVLNRPISEKIASQIKSLMQEVVHSDYGTGKKGLVAGIEMGAKTGTAQIGKKRSNAWFVGYALPNNIPIAFAVIIEGDDNNPQPHGGPVAGPVAKAMIIAAKNSPDLNISGTSKTGDNK